MPSVIEVQELYKTYQLPRRARKGGVATIAAVKGISFNVIRGEIFGILGPNGAGKTTTLEIIEGLKQQTSGTVTVLGFNNQKSSQEIKQRIGVQLQESGFVPYLTLQELLQLFTSLYEKRSDTAELRPDFAKALSGGSNAPNQTPALPRLPLRAYGRSPVGRQEGRNLHRTPEQLLSFVGLQDKAHEVVKNLSGGQKQRFTLATSLVNEPEILFLDEPTTGLDPGARREVWQLVRDINSRGITVVLTSHYMEEAEYLCHRVAIMDHGEILTINNPQNLVNDLSHTTQISFFTADPLSEDIWQSIQEHIEKVFSNFPKVILEIKSLGAIQKVIDLLHTRNIQFSGFTVKTATLEDVYLDLTGHEFESE